MIPLRAFGPALPRPDAGEAARATIGTALGLLITGLMLWELSTTGVQSFSHPHLIAPFGASAFLIFVVPNSPLSQPWSALVGNAVSALAGLAVLSVPDLPVLPAATLAVALAVAAMALTRSTHPPGGAMALATVLAATPEHAPTLSYILFPVLTGTLGIVGCGMIWGNATGRAYPFHQPATTSGHGTTDIAPERRQSPSPEVLAATLDRLRLAAYIGVEDFARLINAAEAESAGRSLGPVNAASLMSRDTVSVAPDMPLPALAETFRTHRFKTLPICDHDGRFAGLVSQASLVGRADPDLVATDLAEEVTTLPPTASAAELIELLSDGRQQSVPIVEDQRLLGIVSRSDMIAQFVHSFGAR